ITAALNGIVAQRLMRRICVECKEPVETPAQVLRDIQVREEEIGKFQTFHGKGCDACSTTGYKGRIAIYEVLVAKEPLKEMILNGGTASELKAEAIRLGMQTLRMSAINKLKEGGTTVAEVTRVSAAD